MAPLAAAAVEVAASPVAEPVGAAVVAPGAPSVAVVVPEVAAVPVVAAAPSAA